jgi:ATP-binding cassette, subfamily C (CFTR/MRP), member 1
LLLQHLNKTLIGSTTICAYGNEQLVIREGLTLINNYSCLRIARCAINKQLWLHLQLIRAFIVFFIGIFIILSIKNINPRLAGLVLTYAIWFTVLLGLLVRSSATLGKYMDSVKHIDKYFNIDQEKDTVRSPIVLLAN